jgi:hypothetical protein
VTIDVISTSTVDRQDYWFGNRAKLISSPLDLTPNICR